jgi:hypothetical protein
MHIPVHVLPGSDVIELIIHFIQRRDYMIKMKAGFVGFGEINSPRELISKKCSDAKKLLEDAGFELVYIIELSAFTWTDCHWGIKPYEA